MLGEHSLIEGFGVVAAVFLFVHYLVLCRTVRRMEMRDAVLTDRARVEARIKPFFDAANGADEAQPCYSARHWRAQHDAVVVENARMREELKKSEVCQKCGWCAEESSDRLMEQIIRAGL